MRESIDPIAMLIVRILCGGSENSEASVARNALWNGFRAADAIVVVATLVGIVAPAATPMPIVRKLQNVIMEMVRKADVRRSLLAIGVEPVGNTSEAFSEAIAADLKRWADVAKRANLEPE